MDVEMKEIVDQIMENMHLISWWMKELQKQEMGQLREEFESDETTTVAPVKIPRDFVINNRAINNLFIKGQLLYRKLSRIVERKIDEEKKHYKNPDSIAVHDKLCEDMIVEMKNYVASSLASINYVPYKIGKTNITGIYQQTPEQYIMDAEARMQIQNLDEIATRLKSNLQPNTISFSDKPQIIHHIALDELYKYYVFDRIDSYMNFCERNKASLDEEVYDFARENIIKQKYMHYYELLNHKYNGFIQENDYGKFFEVKLAIEDEGERAILNMSEYEFNSNVDPYVESLKQHFEKCMSDIMSIVNDTIQIQNNRQAAQKSIANRNIVPIEDKQTNKTTSRARARKINPDDRDEK